MSTEINKAWNEHWEYREEMQELRVVLQGLKIDTDDREELKKSQKVL